MNTMKTEHLVSLDFFLRMMQTFRKHVLVTGPFFTVTSIFLINHQFFLIIKRYGSTALVRGWNEFTWVMTTFLCNEHGWIQSKPLQSQNETMPPFI